MDELDPGLIIPVPTYGKELGEIKSLIKGERLPMQTLDKYPIPLPGVVGRVVEHEAVLVLPDKGQVKVLNELGARIWELANGERSVREIVLHICDEYAVDVDVAQADTLEFLTDLEERGVVTLSNQPG